jgi:hypothetical protein
MAGSGAKPEDKVLAQPSWPDEVYRVLKEAGIRQIGMVPDAGHSRLIRKINPEALPFVMPPADGVILTTRFRQSVLGDEALYN